MVALEVRLRGVSEVQTVVTGTAIDANGGQPPNVVDDAVSGHSVTGYGTSPVLVVLEMDAVTGLPAGIGHSTDQRRHVVLLGIDPIAGEPAATLRTIRQVRRDGHLIAIDHIGARPEALAMLPLIEPDIIFLAPHLLARPANPETARVVHAVNAHVERTLAAVVATGVDSEQARRRALAIGAQFGQGQLFAANAPLEQDHDDWPAESLAPATRGPRAEYLRSATPFEIVAARRRPTITRKDLLVMMSRMLEAHAMTAGPEAIVLGTFQQAHQFTAATRVVWEALAERAAYAGVSGVGLVPGANTSSGIHFAPLDAGDRLVHEWSVVVIAPLFGAVLSARDLHRGNPERNREFEYVVSYEHRTVIRSAHSILDRFTKHG
ncbi:EAL domain-containing protein [Antrihabitans sp. YC2-6]|uniref:EAL domain-containing protein n=1 Tax=Antrihabitans sp. YC2-6 TaxID=2799498 RepID=UPI0018F78A02|nr:EAL domain-containing protein [Antrihabitans sp. YC2-6]MBJ8346190.1 EAL domain-containing protein [Antrihabitans sp. YC2-6]